MDTDKAVDGDGTFGADMHGAVLRFKKQYLDFAGKCAQTVTA